MADTLGGHDIYMLQKENEDLKQQLAFMRAEAATKESDPAADMDALIRDVEKMLRLEKEVEDLQQRVKFFRESSDRYETWWKRVAAKVARDEKKSTVWQGKFRIVAHENNALRRKIRNADMENKRLREMLALAYAGDEAHLLYTDDGEMQDGREHPYIDFRRDTALEIEEKIRARWLAHMNHGG